MDNGTSIGYWQLTIVMIVVASWLVYRYLAPKGWKEWSRAGLVQAFIIALYAEMYGFPLTIYVLTGFLGIDIPWTHESGHLWAALFGWGALGAMVEMIVGYAFVFFGISLLIEGWREVYVAARQNRLATDGLYGIVRHPQYTGIFIAIFGQLVHWPTIPTLVLFPVILWAYVRLADREESKLIREFGDEYRRYKERVPKFLPRSGEWGKLYEAAHARRGGGDLENVSRETKDIPAGGGSR